MTLNCLWPPSLAKDEYGLFCADVQFWLLRSFSCSVSTKYQGFSLRFPAFLHSYKHKYLASYALWAEGFSLSDQNGAIG